MSPRGRRMSYRVLRIALGLALIGFVFLGLSEGLFLVTLCSNKGYVCFGVLGIGFVLRVL